MQFAVPQFTDVEDKLIGPLTLKQFLVLLAAGGICLLFWSLPIPKFIAIIIDIPFAIAGIALAFASYNSRPMLTYILPFVSFMMSPKNMAFQRESNTSNIVAGPVAVKIEDKKPAAVEESTSGRLKKLAYLLDQKTEEQQALLKDQDQKVKTSVPQKSQKPEMNLLNQKSNLI